MNEYTIRKLIREKKAEARKLVEAAEKREMTEDENAKFESLMAECKALRDKLDKLSATADEEGDDADPDDEPPARSRRSANFEERTAPAIHVKDRGRPYSILRALQLATEGRDLNGLEGEVSRETEKRTGKKAQGFFLPTGADPEVRALMAGGRAAESRGTTLDTTAGTGAVFVTPELPFIELLRSKMVTKELGATFLTGMSGKFSIPRQSGPGTASWVAESTAITAVNQTLDQVPFVDKTLGAVTTLSRKFIYQSSVDAESFIKNDLALVLAIELDRAAINGSGSGAVPTGIVQNSTVTTASAGIQGGTNGLAPTFAQMVAAETLVANSNADRGALKYLTTPSARGKLKSTVKVSGYPVYIWESNEINGYPAMASNQVPSNLTKGSSSGVCSALIFGNWNDLVVAQWGGIDVIVNPYTGQASGAITISMLMEADIQLRHAESFAVVSDLLTS